jgi:hypothetical protein
MKEIKLGTIENMVEMLKEYLRKKWQWAEQWLGVHYVVAGFFFGFGSYTLTYAPEGMPHEHFAYIGIPLLIIYIISAWHWIKTRRPKLLRDEHGRYTFTYKPIHGERAVLNLIQRAKDIRANSKIPVITLIKGNKVRVEQNGQKSTRTAKKFGMAGKNGKPVHNWTLTKKFSLSGGSYDFKKDVNWNLEKEKAKVRQQLQGFRKQLSISLGIPDFEIGVDYTFQNGFFEWKSIVWRDTSVPQWEKDQVAEADTIMRKNVAGAYIKASLTKPDTPDYKDSDWYE